MTTPQVKLHAIEKQCGYNLAGKNILVGHEKLPPSELWVRKTTHLIYVYIAKLHQST